MDVVFSRSRAWRWWFAVCAVVVFAAFGLRPIDPYAYLRYLQPQETWQTGPFPGFGKGAVRHVLIFTAPASEVRKALGLEPPPDITADTCVITFPLESVKLDNGKHGLLVRGWRDQQPTYELHIEEGSLGWFGEAWATLCDRLSLW